MVMAQSADLHNPPLPVERVIKELARNAPKFADMVQSEIVRTRESTMRNTISS
jgi:hypothetical protein